MLQANARAFAWTATQSDAAALVLDLTRTVGATFMHGVPTILQTLFAAATAERAGLAGLKMMIAVSEQPTAIHWADDDVTPQPDMSAFPAMPLARLDRSFSARSLLRNRPAHPGRDEGERNRP